MKLHLSIAPGNVLNVRLAATTELPKKLLLGQGTNKHSKWDLLLARCIETPKFNVFRKKSHGQGWHPGEAGSPRPWLATRQRAPWGCRAGGAGGWWWCAQAGWQTGGRRWNDTKQGNIRGLNHQATSCSLILVFAGQGGLGKLCSKELMGICPERDWTSWSEGWALVGLLLIPGGCSGGAVVSIHHCQSCPRECQATARAASTLWRWELSGGLPSIPARFQSTPSGLLFKKEKWLPYIMGWMFKPWHKTLGLGTWFSGRPGSIRVMVGLGDSPNLNDSIILNQCECPSGISTELTKKPPLGPHIPAAG